MKSVRLYGYATSPFVAKTACFLYFKGVDFTHVPVNPIDPVPVLGFTGQTQVPVLEIDGEWRLESSQHAYWLDEVFSEKPLCPPEHAEKIRALDHWADHTFVIGTFFRAVHDQNEGVTHDFRVMCWRASALVSAQTPLSDKDRNDWPELVRDKMPFVKHMGRNLDLSESTAETYARVFGELVEHLGDGPFFGELDAPTMLDFSLFPNLVTGYLVGMEGTLGAAQHPAVGAWLKRVAEHLPANPTLHADEMLVHTLAEGFARE